MSGNNSFSQGPFSFGPSGFDMQSIASALSGNQAATTNRYKQLGLGGSTMEGQDQSFQGLAASALTGQEQTADVTNPAINTALQQPIGTGNPTKGSSISQVLSGLTGH